MKYRYIFPALAMLIVILSAIGASAQSAYRFSAPHTYKNLTIFLIYGKDEAGKGNVMTLQEAMERKLFVVYETSNVNELEVENLSKEFDVFIQAGDIVKGGRQDRVLAVSIIIPARSGRIKIESFCVESGRWSKRGAEDSGKFTSSNDRVVTRDLKIAANASRSQSEVWEKVSDAQAKLERNVGAPVKAAESASSLQLSLENGKVAATVDEYVKNLTGIVNGRTDIIGYAFAINGKLNSVDIYASNALFKKLWQKNLKATATEAVAESRSVRLAEPVKAKDVEDFIERADKAKPRERVSPAGATVTTRDDGTNLLVEARDSKTKAVVHRSYIKKD